MKFKEALDLKTVIFQDEIEKFFDPDTVQTCLELEETIQEFWNVERSSANFLNLLIKMSGAKSALEVGTSNGYSAIWLAHALKETGGRLITVEYWEKRISLAKDNFARAKVDDIVETVLGDAIDVLKDMAKGGRKFDFVFLDANKAEYVEYFESIDKMLVKGGIIVADNILTHYKKTEPYVQKIMNDPNYQSQLLNFDAGLLVSRKGR